MENQQNGIIQDSFNYELLELIQKYNRPQKHLTTAPSYQPSSLFDQIAFFDDGSDKKIYFFVNGVWANTSPKYYVGYNQIPGGSTGNMAFTGIGFKPKMIIMHARYDTALTDAFRGTSDGHATSSSDNKCHAVYFLTSLGGIAQIGSSNLYHLIGEDSFDDASGTLASFDTDGFTINRITANESCNIIYECFG